MNMEGRTVLKPECHYTAQARKQLQMEFPHYLKILETQLSQTI